MKLSNIVKRPIVTEKSMAMEADSKYTFYVNPKASKGAIADEIERLYNVDVVNVNTMIMPGKKRRIIGTRKFAKTKTWKKAVVQLQSGQKIEIVSG